MSLRSKIKSAVDKAFVAAGDLVKDGVLENVTMGGYDFATRSVTKTSTTESVRVIITQKTYTSGGDKGEREEWTFIMKSGPKLDMYDTITVDGVGYKIASYTDNDFAIEGTLGPSGTGDNCDV